VAYIPPHHDCYKPEAGTESRSSVTGLVRRNEGSLTDITRPEPADLTRRISCGRAFRVCGSDRAGAALPARLDGVAIRSSFAAEQLGRPHAALQHFNWTQDKEEKNTKGRYCPIDEEEHGSVPDSFEF
jgi:hypothetical protein